MPVPFALDAFDLGGNEEVRALLREHPDIVPVRFTDQEFLIHGTDTDRNVYLVLRGSCLVEQADATDERTPGQELAIIEATPGAPVFVGEMAYLGDTTRAAAVRSAMSTWALQLQPDHLDRIIESHPRLTRILCQRFASRLRVMTEQVSAQRAKMQMNFTQRFLNANDVICEADQPATHLLELQEGAAVLFREGQAADLIALPEKPAFIDPLPYFLGQPHTLTARAKTRCILTAVDATSRLAAIRNFPELALDLLTSED